MGYAFIEEEVVVRGEYEISATLTIPQGEIQKFPAIVIVSGTGGANRDGNMKKFNMNIYRQLAEFLSSLGFVTIRYDKRGIAKSKGDAYKTGMMDLVDDIISNVNYLRSVPYVNSDKIILLGHSEGCILSTIANSKCQVSGLMLIAGGGSCLKTAMQSQNYMILEEVKNMKGLKGAFLRKVISEKQVIQKQSKLFNSVLSSKEDIMKIQLKKFPAKWLREHLNYSDQDILNILNSNTCPVFVTTGDKDVQANSEDLNNIKALKKENIKCFAIKDMDHMLRECKGEKTILNLKKQYKLDIEKPIHSELKEKIKAWCLKNYEIN